MQPIHSVSSNTRGRQLGTLTSQIFCKVNFVSEPLQQQLPCPSRHVAILLQRGLNTCRYQAGLQGTAISQEQDLAEPWLLGNAPSGCVGQAWRCCAPILLQENSCPMAERKKTCWHPPATRCSSALQLRSRSALADDQAKVVVQGPCPFHPCRNSLLQSALWANRQLFSTFQRFPSLIPPNLASPHPAPVRSAQNPSEHQPRGRYSIQSDACQRKRTGGK